MEIAPSILSADFRNLMDQVNQVENAVKYLHIDIMDGHFVDNLSFGPMIVEAIRNDSQLKFDCHLMVTDPEKYVPMLVKAGADIIGVHVEATSHIHRVIDLINRSGKEAEVVINPGTPVSLIKPLLSEVQSVLVMTVDPGAGGQKMIMQCLEKVTELKQLRETNGYDYRIEVDGGVNEATIKEVANAGVDVAVAGSYVFNSANPKGQVEKLMKVSQLNEI